jgi:hypothetical protein
MFSASRAAPSQASPRAAELAIWQPATGPGSYGIAAGLWCKAKNN